jgi:hypothetical protein
MLDIIALHGLHACQLADRYARGSHFTEIENYRLSFFSIKEIYEMADAYRIHINSKSTNE